MTASNRKWQDGIIGVSEFQALGASAPRPCYHSRSEA